MQYLKAKVQSVHYWSTESVRYTSENIIPYFCAAFFLKISYVIPHRTFLPKSNRTVIPYRSNPFTGTLKRCVNAYSSGFQAFFSQGAFKKKQKTWAHFWNIRTKFTEMNHFYMS